MDRDIFERNLLALSVRDRDLCTRLTRAHTGGGHYHFIPAKTGELIPALRDAEGMAHPLQSIMDPKREARRLLTTVQGPVFLVIFGLAGGDLVAAALERHDIQGILVIEFGVDAVAELLASRAYHQLLGTQRVSFLVDPSAQDIEKTLSAQYQPAFSGGIRVLPILQRTRCDQERYNEAGEAVRKAISVLSRDYSVQAHFGRRWFANTLRNIGIADRPIPPLPSCREAIIAAAGPSLEEGCQEMRNRPRSTFLLATDTALQHLLTQGIIPDGVISIDCQHISYLHVMEKLPSSTRFFLDLASPRQLGDQTEQPFFLASAHPLSRYIARIWRAFPLVDSSGGNVTHAAVSLALGLGARTVRIFGADYCYPRGETYARGTYIHRLFSLSQTRLTPLSAQFFSFARRDPLARIERDTDTWRIATDTLDSYRKALLSCFSGAEATIILGNSQTGAASKTATKGGVSEDKQRHWQTEFRTNLALSGPGPAKMGGKRFLERYAAALAALPRPEASYPEYLAGLNDDEREVFYTILPMAAQMRRVYPQADTVMLFDKLISAAIDEISRCLATGSP